MSIILIVYIIFQYREEKDGFFWGKSDSPKLTQYIRGRIRIRTLASWGFLAYLAFLLRDCYHPVFCLPFFYWSLYACVCSIFLFQCTLMSVHANTILQVTQRMNLEVTLSSFPFSATKICPSPMVSPGRSKTKEQQ